MMTWCNISHNNNNNNNPSSSSNNNNTNNNLITSNNNMKIPLINENSSSSSYEDEDFINNPSEITNNPLHTISCPSCGHNIPTHHDHHQAAGGFNDLPGLPAGVKFDPTDPEVLGHLEAKVNSDLGKLHPLLDQFIPTIEGENGICSTHPEKLPGVSKDGVMRHFFHCPSKAYTTGTRKRRKVSMDEDGAETRWHKTGKTRPILVNGVVKGYKKILVLYTNFGRQRKPEKTNWVMHQYHLGEYEEETEGEYVLSKIFYQTQPRQCASNNLIKAPPAETPLIRTTPLSFYHPHYMSTYDHGVTSQAIMALQGQGSRFVRLSGARK